MKKLVALLFMALLAGCSGLAGEPRIVSSLPPPTPVPTDVGHPLQPPDIAAGAQIFAANCVRCHGADGAGTGELVQNGQVPKPLSFRDAATSSQQRPDTWYDTITNGNIEHLMPPWRDALTDQQRWDVAMYTYTLADAPDQIARGQQVFTENCVECHGERGRGDGPRSEKIGTLPADLTDLKEMASLSRDLLFKTVTEGMGDDMPSFADKLTDDQRRDVIAYVRTLALVNPDAIGTTPVSEAATAAVQAPVATAEVTEAVMPSTVTISGKITDGTAGSSAPNSLGVILYVFDASLNRQQTTGTAGADGSFSFADVPLDLGGTYVVTTTYRDHIFASDLLAADALKADAADGTLNLPVTVYELTEDPDVIQVSQMVTQVTVSGDNMQVTQAFNFTNTSDRAFTSSRKASSGAEISLVITLPPGAVVVGFPNDQNRYVVDAPSFTFFDTVPVIPGEDHLVQVVYLIPYSQGAIIEQPMNYAVNGAVRLLIDPPGITVTSAQLPAMGAQTLGNTQYAMYGAPLTLAAGDVLRYEVSGAGLSDAANAARNAPVVSSNNLVPVVIGALLIVGLLGGGLFLVASRSRSGDQQVIDILVRQIAELDADHDAGKIADDAYEAQRSALKARLAALMARSPSGRK
jgi:mono/diheme cytochrome c family protein